VGLKLLSLLKNANVIALDTAPFIYFIEENPTYINIVEPLFQEISRGNLRAVTSYITPEICIVSPDSPKDEKVDELRPEYDLATLLKEGGLTARKSVLCPRFFTRFFRMPQMQHPEKNLPQEWEGRG
jgi:hypothetical protein